MMTKYSLFFISIFLLTTSTSFAHDEIQPHILSAGNNPGSVVKNVDLNGLDDLRSAEQSFNHISSLAKASKLESFASTRSAIDANLFKTISPSVVIIFTKDSIGSGSLIDDKGRILTNYHVVKGNSEVGVYFKPEKDFQKLKESDVRKAKVIKIDEVADLAIIQVLNTPVDRSPIKLGDVSDIAVGQDVHAIGHPEGQTWTYTKGVVSQYRTNFKWLDNQADVIQTQTPINPGNSGGPLLTDRGLLIGVNSFFQKDSNGLNFAVSVDDVKKFIARPGSRFNKKIATASTKPKAKKSSCESKTLYTGKSDDGKSEIIQVDTSCKGKVDALFTYPYEINQPYTLEMDRNGDGVIDLIVFSFKRNDKWDISYWDTEFTGKYNSVGLHADGSITPTEYVTMDQYKTYLNSKSDTPSNVSTTATPVDNSFHGYASVYFDTVNEQSTGVFGWSIGYQTQDLANKAGYDICIARGAKGTCRQMLGTATRCIAIAQSDKRSQSGKGPTKEAAERTVLAECNKYGSTCYIPQEGSACNDKW